MDTRNVDPVWDLVEAKREDFEGLADRVFDAPEIAYTERKAVAEHTAMLRAQGFRVTETIAGIPTAVMGEWGEGGPVIAILGEYDALPALSQKPGVATHDPVEENGHGHGCGHNLLGSAAILAATAVRDWLEAEGVPGRVRYYGCPAEEGGAAKTYMVRDGLFADVDAAITWHPASYTGVDPARSLANTRIDFTFHGKAAHAAGAPELGRSALDAVELMNIGVNYLREHMPDEARVHYAYLDAGGIAPNVVPARATVRQLIRARDLAGLADLVTRVRAIADGAALMTGTRVESRVHSAVSNLIGNDPLEEALQRVLDGLGPVPFDAADRSFAEEIRKTLSRGDVEAAFRDMGRKPDYALPLCDFVLPLDRPKLGGMGSTDVGDVSWAVPTVQARVATCAIGTPLHTWQMTAQGKAPAAHKGMAHAAKAMAGLARMLMRDERLRAAAKADHAERLAQSPYSCPIPADVRPPVAKVA
ncbi:M20 family metallopeptidase [Salinarimonas ramus]|uniref:Peptidase M20 n=1 Tax=Salinarimonas ramus TaxID=690164 RepID=A0A917Q8A1_9HYPH|nr:M20 family metallopeptidase [Salinarimonas ramus]GGK35166.1 peptidase M20 [Salinarimonas ramus]